MDNRFVKEQIRIWLKERASRDGPPPEPEKIRYAVGWALGDEMQHTEQEQHDIALS